MKNTKAISPEVHAEIVRLAAAGVNTKEIAAQFGISRNLFSVTFASSATDTTRALCLWVILVCTATTL
jgi:transposase-like protein